nr:MULTISPECIES: hypothetical protein [Chlorobiaceae]
MSYWSVAVDRSELKPIIKVKDMMTRHKENMLNFFRHLYNQCSERRAEQQDPVDQGIGSRVLRLRKL